MMQQSTKAGIALSGGGLRACASAAVFALVLMQRGIWAACDVGVGVSGGSWLLLALTRGKLRDVLRADTDIETLLRALTESGIVAELPAVAEVEREVAGKLTQVAASAAQTTTSIHPFAGAVVAASTLVGAPVVAKRLVAAFGTGAVVAIGPEPLKAWGEYLHTLLIGPGAEASRRAKLCDADREGTAPHQRGGPALHAAAIMDSAGAYRWLTFAVSPGEGGAVRLLPRGQIPGTVLHAGGTLLSEVAALCGSAFAFDVRLAVEEACHPSVASEYCPTPVMPQGVTGSLTLAQQNPPRAVVLSSVRDAGIDCNIPFAALTGCDVVWALDCSAGGRLGGQLEVARRRGHVGASERVDGEGGHWGLYHTEALSEDQQLQRVAYFMGLTDDSTMEVASVAARLLELRELYERLCRDVEAAQQRLESGGGSPA